MHWDAEADPVDAVVLPGAQEVQLVWLSIAWYIPKAQSTHFLVGSSQYVPGVHVTEIYPVWFEHLSWHTAMGRGHFYD